MSRLPLASAALSCSRRRATSLAASRRSVALAVASALGLGAVVGSRAGVAAAGLLEPALREVAVTRALVVGLGLVGLASGLAVGAVLEGVAALGLQHAASAASTLDRGLAVVGPPFLVTVVGVTAVVGPLALPVAVAAPAGRGAVAPIVTCVVAAIAVGGMIASIVRGAGALWRAREGAEVLLGALVAAGAGAAAQQSAGHVLAGELTPFLPVGLAVLSTASALTVWGATALLVDDLRGSRLGSRAVRGGPYAAGAGAAVLLLLRRHDLRCALGGGVVLGVLGLAIARLGSAPPPSGLALASTGAALTAAPVALAVGGALEEGRHLWRLTPARPCGLAVAWTVAAAVGLAPVLLVAVLAWLLEGGSPGTVAAALAMGAVVWSSGLAVGGVVPWRCHGIVDQALSLAALGVWLGGLSLAASRLGPVLVDQGLPAAAAGAAIVATAAAAAVVALGQRVGRWE